MSFVRHYVMTTEPEKAEAFGDTLAALRDAVAGCRGSLRIDLLQAEKEPHRFFFIEHWESREDHAAAGSQLPPELMKSLKTFLTAPPESTDLTDLRPA